MSLSQTRPSVVAHAWRDGALLAIWCGIIFMLSAQPSVPMPQLFPHIDKLIHGTAYALMGWLAWRAFRHTGLQAAATFVLPAIFCSLYGVSDEWHQSFVPGRMVEVGDWLADSVGGVIGAVVAARFFNR